MTPRESAKTLKPQAQAQAQAQAQEQEQEAAVVVVVVGSRTEEGERGVLYLVVIRLEEEQEARPGQLVGSMQPHGHPVGCVAAQVPVHVAACNVTV